ncbi:DUF1810 family protein [Endozoicomonas elysicola]|uniref:DUF1810 family protein n=1 Tax=Endozoicomonas elysicola TaxID=305900 RepID=UPI00039EC207|nr:DUF1810 family protein [Endozoicomonas elysicola]
MIDQGSVSLIGATKLPSDTSYPLTSSDTNQKANWFNRSISVVTEVVSQIGRAIAYAIKSLATFLIYASVTPYKYIYQCLTSPFTSTKTPSYINQPTASDTVSKQTDTLLPETTEAFSQYSSPVTSQQFHLTGAQKLHTVTSGANTLERFLKHQNNHCPYSYGKSTFQQALIELQNGLKQGHWCWYIFPQVAGLGINPSQACLDFEIKSLHEAQEYWSHPTLQARLLACCNAVNQHAGRSIEGILGGGRMGEVDALKLHACATLFYQVSGGHPAFQQILQNFYYNSPHQQTLQVLSREQPLNSNWPHGGG